MAPKLYREVQLHESDKAALANKSASRRLGVIDLFAGIGCVAQGFERTGNFETILLTDICQDAYDTYIHNFPSGSHYLRRDISRVSKLDILKIAVGRPIMGVLGCPPCQGFSSAGLRDAECEAMSRPHACSPR